MDVTFFESSPFYTKNHLHRDNTLDDNFWAPIRPVVPVSSNPNPTVISSTTMPSPTVSHDPPMPNIVDDSHAGGERQTQTELHVYSCENCP